MIWLSALGHHGEPADPALLEWIAHRLDELISFGPLTVVIVLGLVIVGMPAALVAWYWLVRRRHDQG